MANQQHRIQDILEVQLGSNITGVGILDTRFLVQFGCQCCEGQTLWLSKFQLQQMRLFDDTRLFNREQSAIREYKQLKEKETRQNVEELLQHLEFADIKDFRFVSSQDFEEVNFFSEIEHHLSEDNTENQSEQLNLDLEEGKHQDLCLPQEQQTFVQIRKRSNSNFYKHNSIYSSYDNTQTPESNIKEAYQINNKIKAFNSINKQINEDIDNQSQIKRSKKREFSKEKRLGETRKRLEKNQVKRQHSIENPEVKDNQNQMNENIFTVQKSNNKKKREIKNSRKFNNNQLENSIQQQMRQIEKKQPKKINSKFSTKNIN